MTPTVGMRVELPVHHDLWMRGARFGVVAKVDDKYARVRVDHPQVKGLVPVSKEDWEYMKEIKRKEQR